jgi:hypothetical protein
LSQNCKLSSLIMHKKRSLNLGIQSLLHTWNLLRIMTVDIYLLYYIYKTNIHSIIFICFYRKEACRLVFLWVHGGNNIYNFLQIGFGAGQYGQVPSLAARPSKARSEISIVFTNTWLVTFLKCNIEKITKNVFEFQTWNFDYASNEFNSIKELVHAVSGKASRKHSLKMDEVETFKYKSFNLLYRPTSQLVKNTSTIIYIWSHLWTKHRKPQQEVN